MTMNATCSCDSRKKGQKYLNFLTALHFMKTDADKKKLNKKCEWLEKELAQQQRTGLQAALVCTITKRCSLGNYSIPKQANY